MKIQHSFTENLHVLTFSIPLNIAGLINVGDQNEIQSIEPSHVRTLVIECSTMGGAFTYSWVDDIVELFDNTYLALESKAEVIQQIEGFMNILGVKELNVRTIIPVIRNMVNRNITSNNSDLNILSIKLID